MSIHNRLYNPILQLHPKQYVIDIVTLYDRSKYTIVNKVYNTLLYIHLKFKQFIIIIHFLIHKTAPIFHEQIQENKPLSK